MNHKYYLQKMKWLHDHKYYLLPKSSDTIYARLDIICNVHTKNACIIIISSTELYKYLTIIEINKQNKRKSVSACTCLWVYD